MQELDYMRRALKLSERGRLTTCPNPMVGAVIVKDGRIIGEGWHHAPGAPHAEIEALRDCREDPAGATLYVTLEPCNHYGRTPPCTEAIIRAKISAVHIALPDPNPVARGGMLRLTEAGITVAVGTGRAAALELNRRFCHFCLTGRPWVIMKAAMSLDGKIATASGESKWISGAKARRLVHRLRQEAGAVLIGSGTQRKDDPLLTNRCVKPLGRQPLRVVIDSDLKIPLTSQLVVSAPDELVVFCTDRAARSRQEALEERGVRVVRQDGGPRVDLAQALIYLGVIGIQSVLVEGGGEIFASLLAGDLVNEFYLFYAPFFIGGTAAKSLIGGTGITTLEAVPRLKFATRKIGDDILFHAYREELSACLRV